MKKFTYLLAFVIILTGCRDTTERKYTENAFQDLKNEVVAYLNESENPDLHALASETSAGKIIVSKEGELLMIGPWSFHEKDLKLIYVARFENWKYKLFLSLAYVNSKWKVVDESYSMSH